MSNEEINYCAYDCKNMKCKRNYKNIRQFNIPYSFAYFDDCKERDQEVKNKCKVNGN